MKKENILHMSATGEIDSFFLPDRNTLVLFLYNTSMMFNLALISGIKVGEDRLIDTMEKYKSERYSIISRESRSLCT
jgi:hypothetical protein